MSSLTAPAPCRPARGLWPSLAVLALLALAVFLVIVSFLPQPALGPAVRLLGGEGLARRYSPTIHGKLAPGVRLLGGCLLLGGVLAWPFRRTLAGRLRDLLGQVARDVADELGRVRARGRSLALSPAAAGLLALMLLGGLLRLAFLFQPVRYDEAFTYLSYASRPAPEIVARYEYPNNHVLHTLAVHLSARLLGDAPWALRLPAFLCGILLIPACYLAARALYDRATAWLACALVASSSLLVEYSTNARGYSPLALLVLLQVALSCRLLERPTLLAWLLWVLCGALGFWTLPTMLYPFLGLLAWMGLCRLARPTPGVSFLRVVRELSLAGLATGTLAVVLYLPILLVHGPGALVGNRFVRALPVGEWVLEMPASLGETWRQWQRDIPFGVGLLLPAGFLAALLAHRRVGRQALPLAPVLALACVLLLAGQRVAPFPRVWLFALPLYLTGAAAGAALLLRRLARAGREQVAAGGLAALAALLLAGQAARSPAVLESTDTGTLRDAGPIASLLRGRMGPGDLLVASCPSNAPLLYHFRRGGMPGGGLLEGPLPDSWRGGAVFLVVNTAHGQTLERLIDRHALAPLAGARAPRLLAAFPSASLYQLEDVAGARGARGEVAAPGVVRPAEGGGRPAQ